MVVLGFGMLGAAVAALLGSLYWPLAAVGMATTLAAWLVIETAVIGWRGDRQAVLLTVTVAPALAMGLLGWRGGGGAQLAALFSRGNGRPGRSA